jgi:hypothetical protein
MQDATSWRIGSNSVWKANVSNARCVSQDLQEFQKAQQIICVEAQQKMEELAEKYASLFILEDQKPAIYLHIDIIPECVRNN